MPSPLPRQVRWNLFARTFPSAAAFPNYTVGRLLHYMFRGLLSVHFTLRPACSPSRLSDPLHRRLRRLRFLHRRSDCFRVERTQFPGGTFTHSGPAPFHGARVMNCYANQRMDGCCFTSSIALFTPCPCDARAAVSLCIQYLSCLSASVSACRYQKILPSLKKTRWCPEVPTAPPRDTGPKIVLITKAAETSPGACDLNGGANTLPPSSVPFK